jgi:hypothetical protein
VGPRGPCPVAPFHSTPSALSTAAYRRQKALPIQQSRGKRERELGSGVGGSSTPDSWPLAFGKFGPLALG